MSYFYDAETPDPNWQLGMAGDAATSGIWILADPIGTVYNGHVSSCEDDHTPTPGVQCFVTANGTVGGAAGEADVDGGCTTLRSPIFDLSTAEQAFVSYWRWFGEGGNSADDEFAVDVSNDGGATWVPLERVPEQPDELAEGHGQPELARHPDQPDGDPLPGLRPRQPAASSRRRIDDISIETFTPTSPRSPATSPARPPTSTRTGRIRSGRART